MLDIETKLKALEPLIEREFEKRKIPGLAIGVIHKGNIVFSKNLGYSNLETKEKINIDTIFRLASITKIFTAIGIMQLFEKGLIKSLDDPVNDYLPRSKLILKNPNWNPVTFRHLLTHTSGIGEIPRFKDLFKKGFGMMVSKNVPRPRLSTIHDINVIIKNNPGLKYAYCNFGYSLLGYLTEIISGMQWEDYVRKYILDPLDMKGSDVELSSREQPQEAQGYVYNFGTYRKPKYRVNIISPAGSLYSSVQDMSHFANMLTNDGNYNGKKIISKSSLDLMKSPQYFSHDSIKNEIAIGLCFHLGKIQDKLIIEHSGATSGFTSMFTLIPEEELAICVFSNIDEIFSSRGTSYFKNIILQTIFSENDIIPELESDLKYKYNEEVIKKIEGYYGPYPDVFTNTRVYMTGGDMKVYYKNDRLFFSRLYGPSKKGKLLLPTKDPLIYRYKVKKGSSNNLINTVAFEKNEYGKVTNVNLGLFHLRKNPFYRTFRYFLYSLIILLLFLIILGIFFL